MDLNLIISIIQIVLGVLLGITILLQQKGAGLGAAFGGEGNVYSTRRGAEKFIYRSTIVIAILFVGTAIARLFLIR